MQINISARHGNLSTATQEKIKDKVARLGRFFERLTAAEVTVELSHPENPIVEVQISVERADNVVATEQTENLWASLDGVIHKLEQQLRKHKEKLKGHRTPGHRHPEVPEEHETFSETTEEND